MIQYPAANAGTPPLEWDKSAVFIWARQGEKVSHPKIYRASVAKSRFTSSHRDIIYRWDGGTRHYWEAGKGIPMPQSDADSFLKFSDYLYKLIDDVWVCVFQPDSPAGFEFIQGNLTVRELRDSIDW